MFTEDLEELEINIKINYMGGRIKMEKRLSLKPWMKNLKMAAACLPLEPRWMAN